ncbi:MAG: hypothetical protein OJF49_003752 [Ktedonobacterales bacterium]|nr:MAG: hypothetical protein OJF49_003752 [Ktedonobacterales bacterium]
MFDSRWQPTMPTLAGLTGNRATQHVIDSFRQNQSLYG